MQRDIKLPIKVFNILVNNNYFFVLVLNEVRRAEQTSREASIEAQKAYDEAQQAKENSMRELQEVSSLTAKIDKFTTNDQATPQNVKELAEQVNNFRQLCFHT